jgi:hypothetical protein
MRRPLIWFLLFTIFGLGLTACASPLGTDEGPESTHPQVQKKSKLRFQADNYRYLSDDGRHGITNRNPNLRVGEWSRPSTGQDERRIREKVKQIQGVRDAKVSISGGHAAIQVIPDVGFPKDKYEELQEHVLREATFLMPRYEIRVRVGMSKWNPMRFFQ